MKYTMLFAMSTIIISIGIALVYSHLEKAEAEQIMPTPEQPFHNTAVYSESPPMANTSDMRTKYGIESRSHKEAFVASEDTPVKSENEQMENFPSESYQEQVERLK